MARVTIFVSGGLWASAHLYQLVKMFLYDRSYPIVTERWDDYEVTRIKLRTRPIRVFPGCYFYLFFPGPLPFYDLFHGHRMMPAWSEPGQFLAGSATDLLFLIDNNGNNPRWVDFAVKGNRLRMDGPYGKDLMLHRFETVVLTAQGSGIVGILPFALHLAARRRHDDDGRDKAARLRDSNDPVFRDLTRKVDLIWWLDRNDQVKLVANELKALQRVDAKNVSVRFRHRSFHSDVLKKLLVVWCVYPSMPSDDPPFEQTAYWKALPGFNLESFSRELRQESRYPGRSIVLGMESALCSAESAPCSAAVAYWPCSMRR